MTGRRVDFSYASTAGNTADLSKHDDGAARDSNPQRCIQRHYGHKVHFAFPVGGGERLIESSCLRHGDAPLTVRAKLQVLKAKPFRRTLVPGNGQLAFIFVRPRIGAARCRLLARNDPSSVREQGTPRYAQPVMNDAKAKPAMDSPDKHGAGTLAQDRTDWAEDRTIMASERTYAGWVRTGLAAIGIGIAFNALFARLEPAWLPKVLASCFVLVGILVFWLAAFKARAVLRRMSAHRAEPLPSTQIDLLALLLSAAGAGLLAGLWMI
jgi:putative membrane protein